MKGGFSFCGVDIADIGLEYAPDNKDTYVYKPGEAEVHEETFDGHDGGYIYGATKRPKEFILRCYFEDKNIAEGIMARAYNLFKIGKSGKLIFKRRPWCYYYATVTGIDSDDLHNYMNGLFVVTMKAYYPYARSTEINGRLFCNLLTDPYHTEIMQNTALLDKQEMVLPTSFNSAPQSPFLLYNPGTEPADVGIVVAGQAGDGVTITNRTTGQSCRYVRFDTTTGSNSGYEIFTDSINGKTVKRYAEDPTDLTRTSLAFLYHDYGFIELAPSFPIIRDLFVHYNGTTVSAVNVLYQDEEEKEWYKGKYIFLGSSWYKITQCSDKHTLTLATSASEGSCKTCVVLMNEIEISTNGTLSKISFIYKPTFA